jgi:hypothetical protein
MVQMLRRDIRNRQARCGQQVFYSGLFRIGKDVHIVVSKKVDFFVGAACCRDFIVAGSTPTRNKRLADKVALRTMTRYSAKVIIAAKAESKLKAFPTKTMLHWL